MADQERFDSLWVFERLLWPLNPQTPYPGSPDGTIPAYLQKVFDPLETLTFVAAKTDKIALGTSVIDMLFHDPCDSQTKLVIIEFLTNKQIL